MQLREGEMEQELNRKTMVIGHRNPDTDSICSAICYANLKQAVTGEEYMPARAGLTGWYMRHRKLSASLKGSTRETCIQKVNV